MKIKSILSMLLLVLFLGGVVAVPTSYAEDEGAVFCGKCKTVFVKERKGVPGKGFRSYRTEEKMTCPDCESAVKNFFTKGKFQHTCDTCGDALVHCSTSN